MSLVRFVFQGKPKMGLEFVWRSRRSPVFEMPETVIHQRVVVSVAVAEVIDLEPICVARKPPRSWGEKSEKPRLKRQKTCRR
ncbi:MAG: hypothetical protein MI923_28870 [Phycisphaerales bacterium]|nr:hypothetical protein [Phycisphaerales bacterium]